MDGNDGNIGTVKKFHHDAVMKYVLLAVASVTVAIILFIILFILANGIDALAEIGPIKFILGGEWKPGSDTYGAMPLIVGTVLVTAGAIFIALPLGLGSAVFISEVAPKRLRNILKPMSEVFAGIPSVVYGFFGLIVVVPMLRGLFPDHLLFGTSWLAGSLILGIMALPTIISVSEDAMRAVPRSYREASMAMGATRWETTRKVVIPAAVSGIAAAAILGIGRAIGETMAVMMVTGNSPMIPEPLWNIFELLRTITSTLALEMPDVVSGSLHYSALFLLALVLMMMVLAINFTAKVIIKRSRRKFGDSSSYKKSFVTKALEKMPGYGIVKKYMPRLVRSLLLVMAFVFIWMMTSLFIDGYTSCILAFAVIVAFMIIKVKRKAPGNEVPPVFKIGRVSGGMNARMKEKVAHGSLFAVVIIVAAVLVAIIYDIVSKGVPALSMEFLFGYPKDGGMGGGIFPAIAGTIQLVIGTMMIAFPLGITSGIYLAEYAKNTRSTRIIREAIDILNGTPSVVFGLFGMAALVIYLGTGYALIAGCITLAFMVLPVIIRTTEESILAVPHELREASLALGASKWETTMKVVIPAAFGGVVTGLILSLGRAAGETAPIMFTAAVVFRSSISLSLLDPVMALPYHLYYLASEVPGSETMQYGAALVLLMIVLLMFALASVVRYKYSKNIKW